LGASLGGLLTKAYLGTGTPGLLHWGAVGFSMLVLVAVYVLDHRTKRMIAEHDQFLAALRDEREQTRMGRRHDRN
jgi:hypothetical protein